VVEDDSRPWSLVDETRRVIRLRHYSIRTEEAYVHWIRRFIRFSGGRNPRKMGQPEVELFLSYLAIDGNVAAATQNQALNAISFLYKRVLNQELGDLRAIVRAKKPRRLPVVLTRSEVMALLSRLDGVPHLASGLMYGAGLRLMETVRLRVKDLDLDRGELVVRNGKGGRDRITVLPARLAGPLRDQLEHARALHLADLAEVRSRENFAALTVSGPGSTYSQLRRAPEIPAAARCGGTTSARLRSSAPSSARFAKLASSSVPVATHCVTISRHTCSKAATTFERSSNCSATAA